MSALTRMIKEMCRELRLEETRGDASHSLGQMPMAEDKPSGFLYSFSLAKEPFLDKNLYYGQYSIPCAKSIDNPNPQINYAAGCTTIMHVDKGGFITKVQLGGYPWPEIPLPWSGRPWMYRLALYSYDHIMTSSATSRAAALLVLPILELQTSALDHTPRVCFQATSSLDAMAIQAGVYVWALEMCSTDDMVTPYGCPIFKSTTANVFLQVMMCK